MPQRDHDAEVVDEIERRAAELPLRIARPKRGEVAAPKPAREQKGRHHQPEQAGDLVKRQPRRARELDAGIDQHPEGVARKRQADCLKL